jgi:YD repeat-containing protein
MTGTYAGTYALTDRFALLSENPEINGMVVYCLPAVAAHAQTLIADGETATVTLDAHGNVVSVQTTDGSRRVEFPKAAQ